MKKFARVVAAGVLALSFQAGSFTVAQAGNNNIQDVCRSAIDAGIFATMGECQSAINKSVVDSCKAFWDVAGYKNQGQCISDLRAALNDFKKA